MSVRVYQLAKQLGLDNKHVVQLLRERGLNVSGPSNTIPSIYADALIEEIGNKKLVFEDKTTASVESNIVAEEESVAANNVTSHEDPIVVAEAEPAIETVVENDDRIVVNERELNVGFQTKDIEQVSEEEINEPVIEEQQDVVEPIAQSKPLQMVKHVIIKSNRIKKSKPANKSNDADKNNVQQFPIQRSQTKKDISNDTTVQEQPVVKFKPFLKKIERQTPSITELTTLEIKPPIVVRALATQMNVKPFQLISKLMSMNIFASMNQEIDVKVAQSVAEKFGFSLVLAKPEIEKAPKQSSSQKKQKPIVKNTQNVVERPPVVCVLGHVDHGKTTLLDTIRHARVAAGEAGGITQHVAAYQIEHNGKKITFIDTPGHAAFSKMRQRGANMTDIGILVVAADDGFMPQTDEALKFAQNANIPVVVAINKIDAKGANVDRVKQQMQQRGITSEDWGGSTLCTEISALKGQNIDSLLELVCLQAEMMELHADTDGVCEGVVLESKIAKGQGPMASAIIQDGTLKIGDYLVCGKYFCKVKSLIDDKGKSIKSAPASTPVNITGWSGLPEVGSQFVSVANEKIARSMAEENVAVPQNAVLGRMTSERNISNVDELFSAIAAVDEKVLKVIVRADVHGSAEALNDFLQTIKSKKIRLEILDCGVGAIDKNDIVLANTTHATIVAFNIKVESSAQALAKQFGVKIIQHNIIYEIIEKVKDEMAGCLDPELHENKMGAAEVRQVFNVKNSVIAGCMVTEGKILRDKFVRVIRRNEIIFQGKFSSIKRQKDDVGEVRAGFECGIVISGFDAVEIGDIIECFEIQKLQPSL